MNGSYSSSPKRRARRDPPRRVTFEVTEAAWRDLGKAVQQLKREPGRGLFTGGVTLPLALADLGLIDEYEFVVQPIVAGHGPMLFVGLGERLELKLVGRQESGRGRWLCVTSPVESGREGRLPLGTRAWQLRHNTEVDTGRGSGRHLDVDRDAVVGPAVLGQDPVRCGRGPVEPNGRLSLGLHVCCSPRHAAVGQ
jgi:RibD C-terminal domain